MPTTDYRPYSNSQYVWWTERDNLAFAYWDDSKEAFRSPNAEDATNTLTLFYYATFGALVIPVAGPSTWHNDELDKCPDQFHHFIVDKAISLAYELGGADNLQMAQYYDQRFEKGIVQGKGDAYRDRIGPTRQIVPVSF